MRPRIHTLAILAATAAGLFLQSSAAQAEARRERDSEKPKPRPIVRATFDKSAEQVELFKGMEQGTLETKVVATGPSGGYVIVGNSSKEPVTVQLPKSFVTVPTKVLKQFGGFGGGGLGGGGLGGGGLGGGGLGGGGQQNQGGGFGGGGLGGGGFGGQQGGFGAGGGMGGQGFFSIPPEKAVKVPYVSACLNHGKADPNPRVDYSIIPVEAYTNDPVLKELIYMVGTGQLPTQAGQAAVWNRTDKMSWQQLSQKYSVSIIGQKSPYFTSNDIVTAQQIAATAVGRLRERGESTTPPAKTERTRVR